MKERPILFSAPMVLALLAGGKTQTRRIVKPQPRCETEPVRPEVRGETRWVFMADDDRSTRFAFGDVKCPYGAPGDRLWVRETWAPCEAPIRKDHFHYAADGAVGRTIDFGGDLRWCRSGHTLGIANNALTGVWVGKPKRWKPSIFMRRAVSRLTLDVTGIRVEKLQEISEMDALHEGVEIATDTEDVYGGDFSRRFRNYDESDPTNTYCVTAKESYRSLWESINGTGSWAANPWVWVVAFKRVTT